MEIDDTTRLVISLDILHQEEEELHKLVQVATPTGVGQQRTCYVLLTSHCTYILRKGEGRRESCGSLCIFWDIGCNIKLYQPLISCHGTRLSSLGRRANKFFLFFVDGIEGHYSRELSIKYSSYDHCGEFLA